MSIRLESSIGLFLATVLVGAAAGSAVAAYTHTPDDIEQTQYANIAPLPGACIAINSDGEPDGAGVFHINIPAAYTPGWGFVGIGAFSGGHVRGKPAEFHNGSGFFSVGFGSRPKLFVSAMQVSHIMDESKAVSFQAALRPESHTSPAVSMGEQDVLDKEPNGRSPYLVLTRAYPVKSRLVFATLGYGGGRFLGNPFGGLSTPLTDSLNFAVEHDGFQMNAGLGWRPSGRGGKVTFLGAYNAKCGWLAGLSAVGAF